MTFETVVFRYAAITCVTLCTPLNLFTMYVIIAKSPKNLKLYKYVLLNISFWVFVYDVTVGVMLLPMTTPTKPIALYFTGIASFFGPVGGALCAALAVLCISECLAAVLLGFCYRYLALNDDFRIRGWKPEPRHYHYGAAMMIVVPPGAMFAVAVYACSPRETFTKLILNASAEGTNILDSSLLIGPEKEGFVPGSVVLSMYIALWAICLAVCIIGIIGQLRIHRVSMSNFTYGLHIQLIKSLAVQTAAPLILFASPVCVVLVGTVFNLKFLNCIV
ncbi:hypothetical protein QR680_016154 [Steinernema hermaphroditum]|uniref:G-protein coupled receptors family 1 profile domain-containing protein n=1 Tax=Steinernema hermaphroditum TaxID=289476 RepID=A0AA39HCS3_9BILA|nr:hypothetical protein QR680_016154 [Steinernema hermaphroditum]